MKIQFQFSVTSARQACHACLRVAWLLIVLGFAVSPAQAAVIEAWRHRYDHVVGRSYDEAVKVARDLAGDIIVTGTTEDGTSGKDILTIKYSGANGSVLWQRRYNGPGNGDDSASGLAVDQGGNVVVTGYSDNGGEQNFRYDFYTAKYAAEDGALLWEKRNRGPANRDAFAQAIAVDASGNVAVTGTSYPGDYFTAKYAAFDGALLWENRYHSPGNDYSSGEAVAMDASGNAVVTGFSGNGINYDYYTAKYASADGALLWEKRYNGPANGSDGATALTLDSSGNVAVTGNSWNGTNRDIYTVKYSGADGAPLWEKRYNDNAGANAYAVAVDSSGDVVVTGSSSHGNTGRGGYYTAKYAAANGALVWEKSYNAPANSPAIGLGLALDAHGNVVVTGISYGDYNTVKYASADGALLWERRHASGSASAVAVDDGGDVVVTGSSNADYVTAKYAAADGSLLWEKRYDGPASMRDFPTAAVMDSNGDVVVTGSSNGTNSTPDYYTAKYAAANGALLWEKRHPGPAYQEDYTPRSSLAVDAIGNVVVAGYRSNFEPSYEDDYYTAKFAATDGALLWERRYDSGSFDAALAVAVDGSGNIVVTGFSYTDDSYSYTAKYASADGTILWERRSAGIGQEVAVDGADNVIITGAVTTKYLANGTAVWTNGGATALALDRSGNVVVTGNSWNGADLDYRTAKYSGADGALLWENRYNGWERSDDIPYAVAVDGSGNVVVTGNSRRHGNFTSDYYTAKYAAEDGTLIWEQSVEAPDYYATPNAVAVDSSGNVVMTSGFFTAKYAAADGALLWEEHNEGLAVYGSHSLAIGPNGMVVVTGFSSLGASTGDYLTVAYRDDVYPISIALVPDGIRLRFIGVPGRNYTIERAPGVNGPWNRINTQTAPASGLVEYVDAAPPAGSAFYRTVQP